MQYGVHLMCAEDGLDSSTAMGKMMITILGAVAELERENIITQSLLGCRQHIVMVYMSLPLWERELKLKGSKITMYKPKLLPRGG